MHQTILEYGINYDATWIYDKIHHEVRHSPCKLALFRSVLTGQDRHWLVLQRQQGSWLVLQINQFCSRHSLQQIYIDKFDEVWSATACDPVSLDLRLPQADLQMPLESRLEGRLTGCRWTRS